MSYPKGTKFNNWALFYEKQKNKSVPIVRRWIVFENNQKYLERLPVKMYKSLRDDPEELKLFIIRLNQEIPVEQRTIEKIEIRHAFINPILLDTYKEFLQAQIPSKDRANYEYNLLVKYFLNFFINTLNINSPVQWHKIHKTEWAQFLLSDKAPNSVRSKKEVVSAANRFILWLHDRRPEEVPPLRFEPLSEAKCKEVEATRKLNGEARTPKMIKDVDWMIIRVRAPADIKPFILLAYFFGIRRSETLGLKLEDVRKGYISIERQLTTFTDNVADYGPLKGREEKRLIPYWFCRAEAVFELIKMGSEYLMHPDTLTNRWTEFMNTLGFDYTFHDIRHTWITKAMRKKEPRDVMLAAGHKNIKTTMGYLHDDRDLDSQHFVPDKKSS